MLQPHNHMVVLRLLQIRTQYDFSIILHYSDIWPKCLIKADAAPKPAGKYRGEVYGND